jgi:hypothetical protein
MPLEQEVIKMSINDNNNTESSVFFIIRYDVGLRLKM